jgi:hypothetical protein
LPGRVRGYVRTRWRHRRGSSLRRDRPEAGRSCDPWAGPEDSCMQRIRLVDVSRVLWPRTHQRHCRRGRRSRVAGARQASIVAMRGRDPSPVDRPPRDAGARAAGADPHRREACKGERTAGSHARRAMEGRTGEVSRTASPSPRISGPSRISPTSATSRWIRRASQPADQVRSQERDRLEDGIHDRRRSARVVWRSAGSTRRAQLLQPAREEHRQALGRDPVDGRLFGLS